MKAAVSSAAGDGDMRLETPCSGGPGYSLYAWHRKVSVAGLDTGSWGLSHNFWDSVTGVSQPLSSPDRASSLLKPCPVLRSYRLTSCPHRLYFGLSATAKACVSFHAALT